MNRIKILLNNEGIRYIFFGILTTLVNILCYVVLNKLGVYYVVSNVTAFILSTLFAFVTNKLYVFNSKTWELKVAIKEGTTFLASRLASLLIDTGLMILLIEILAVNWIVSKFIVNVIVVIINYLLSKVIVFKKSNK